MNNSEFLKKLEELINEIPTDKSNRELTSAKGILASVAGAMNMGETYKLFEHIQPFAIDAIGRLNIAKNKMN